VNGIDASDRPALNADFDAVRTGFDNDGVGIVFNADYSSDNSADCGDIIADLDIIAHFFFIFLFLGLGTDSKKIKSADNGRVKENDGPCSSSVHKRST